MSSLLEVGINSLMAAKYALSITNQNIANANNPYYTRRIVDFKEANYTLFGDGVTVSDVRRIFDNVANQSLIKSKSSAAAAERCYQQFKGFEPLLDDKTTNIANYLKQSLTQLNSVNMNASSVQSRGAYLSQLNTIANQFNQVSAQINDAKNNIKFDLAADVAQVNILSEQLFKLNNEIMQASSEASMPLLDERDRLLNKMAEYINFTSSMESNGVMNIQLSNGTPLVTGSRVNTLTVTPSITDKSVLDIAVDNGTYATVVTPLISGGTIAASLSFQENGLNAADKGLNRLALALAFEINAQHKLGMDLNGNLGQNVFSDLNSATISSQRVLAQSTNTGSGSLSVGINDVSKLTLSDYQLTFTTGTQYQLVRTSDNQVMSSGALGGIPFELDVDGFTLSISSANFVAGDTFKIAPLTGAASSLSVALTDPSQLAIAFPVVTSPSASNKGNGAITLNTMTDTSTAAFSIPGQLTPPIVIEFTSPTTYRLVSGTDNSILVDNLNYDPIAGASVFPTPGGYDPGYRITLSGQMQTGDQFQVNYNEAGLSDNRNGLMLAGLYQQNLLDGGKLNFIQGYNALSDDISSKTNVAKINDTAQGIIKTQAELRRDEISGVSIEEEAMNIARYQEAYKASAQILDTIRSMFDEVLNLMRR